MNYEVNHEERYQDSLLLLYEGPRREINLKLEFFKEPQKTFLVFFEEFSLIITRTRKKI